MARRIDRGVFERDGAWWIEYYDERGCRRRKKVGKKSDAQRAVEQVRAKVRLSKIAPELTAQTAKRKSLADIIDHRIEISTNRPRTQKEERRQAQQWKNWMPGVLAEEVTPTKLKQWVAKRRKEVAPATVNRSLAFLKTCFNEAIEAGWLTLNPVARVKLLKENNERDAYLSRAQFAQLKERLHPDAMAIVELAILTGMRSSELFGLRREEVDPTKGQVKLKVPKSGQKEWVALNTRAREILADILSRHNSEWVFPSRRKEGPIGCDHFFCRVVRPVLDDIGATGLTWHSFRHTFGSWLAEDGVPMAIIQSAMRHASARMTERYVHLSRSQVKDAVELLATATRTATAETQAPLKLDK